MASRPAKRPRTAKDAETVKRIRGDIPDDISEEMRKRVTFLGAPPHLLPPTAPTTSWTFQPETPQRIQNLGSISTRTCIKISSGDGTEHPVTGGAHVVCMFHDLGTCVGTMISPLAQVTGETPVEFPVEFAESFKRSGGLNFEYHRDRKELIGERGGVIAVGTLEAPMVPLPNIRDHTIVRGTVDDPEMFLQSFSTSGTAATNSVFRIRPIDTDTPGDMCVFEVSFDSAAPVSSRRLGIRLDVGDTEALAAMKEHHFSPRILCAIRCIASNTNRPTKCTIAFARPGGGDVAFFIAVQLPGGTVIRCMLVEFTPRRGNIRRQGARHALRTINLAHIGK